MATALSAIVTRLSQSLARANTLASTKAGINISTTSATTAHTTTFAHAQTLLASALLANFCGGNIEGAHVRADLKRANPLAKWYNLVLVLDSAQAPQMNFDHLLAKIKQNNLPTLEAGIDYIDETQLLAAYVAVIDNVIKTHPGDKVAVHIHTDASFGRVWQQRIEHVLQRTDIPFLFDAEPHYYQPGYEYDPSIQHLISLSQCIGLTPPAVDAAGVTTPCMDLLIPDIFVPFDFESKTLALSQSMAADNELAKMMQLEQDILKLLPRDHVPTIHCRLWREAAVLRLPCIWNPAESFWTETITAV